MNLVTKRAYTLQAQHSLRGRQIHAAFLCFLDFLVCKVNRLGLRIQCAGYLLVASVLFLSSCKTPSLKSFSESSTTLSTNIKKGGELAIKPLAATPLWITKPDGSTELVQPSSPEHPFKKLDEEWDLRCKAMDAVIAYGSALEGLTKAARNEQENAGIYLHAIQDLAGAVPGYGAAFNAVGNLVVTGLNFVAEIGAQHELKKAVEAADPTIQILATGLTKDLEALSIEYKAPLKVQVAQILNEMRPLLRLEKVLRTQRDTQRTLVETAVSDAEKGAELTRLEGLYTITATDLEQKKLQLLKVQTELSQGQDFFRNASSALQAWAQAHAQLVQALRENRRPNLSVLAARAQEVKDIVEQLRKDK